MADKVVLGLYTGAYTCHTYATNVLQLAMALKDKGMFGGVISTSSCRVDSNRNRIIYNFLNEYDDKFLFIIDEDMLHPSQMPVILAERDLPVVSGLYFRRGNRDMFTPQFYKMAGQDYETRPGHGKALNNHYEAMVQEVNKFFTELDSVPNVNTPLVLTDSGGKVLDHGLLQMDGGGFGCLMIRRDTLEKLEEPYLLSEPGLNGDLVFYKQCREKGIEVWGDCSVIASHNHNAPIGVGAFADFMWRLVNDTNEIIKDREMDW